MGRRVEGVVVNRGVPVVWTGERYAASDDELAGKARRGDPEAFTVLYHRYKLDVWRLAWHTLHDHHEAEDALQETFLKAHRSLGQYHRTGTMRPWLLAICRNACRDRLRAGHRREAVPLDDDVAAGGAEDRERELDFRRALEGLAEEDREAFLLVDVLGCRSEEAARIAGVPAASTVRSRLGRARRALGPALGEPVLPDPGSEDVWGVLRCADHGVIVVASPGAGPGPSGGAVRGGDQPGLVGFLDTLDRAIPSGRAVRAILDDRPAGHASAAAPWLGRHPRWSLQRAPTRACWLEEVDDLLGRWHPSIPADRDRVRAHLSAGAPFRWTCAG